MRVIVPLTVVIILLLSLPMEALAQATPPDEGSSKGSGATASPEARDDSRPSPAPDSAADTRARRETREMPLDETPSDDGGAAWKTTLGWTAIGLGGAALVTGIIFGALAQNESDAYSDAVAGDQLYQQLAEIEDRGMLYEKVQIGTLVVSVIAITVGANLVYWGWTSGRESSSGRVSLSPVVGSDSVGLAGQAQF